MLNIYKKQENIVGKFKINFKNIVKKQSYNLIGGKGRERTDMFNPSIIQYDSMPP